MFMQTSYRSVPLGGTKMSLSPAAGPGTGDIAMPHIRPSVCPSVYIYGGGDLLAGDLGRPSCLVIKTNFLGIRNFKYKKNLSTQYANISVDGGE